MSPYDANQYLNLPYAAGGRDRAGVDCWGLARMVYAEQFGIDLPGHDEATIEQAEPAALADYMAAHMEGWQRVENPQPGDLIRLRSGAEPYHVGIIAEPGWFLHVRSGQRSVQERYTAAKWSRRIEGFYRYAPRRAVTISGRPHPLKTVRIDGLASPGTSLAAAIGAHCAGLHPDLVKRGIAFVNGRRVAQSAWPTTILTEGDAVDFRMLPGDDERSFLMLVVAVVAAVATSGASSAWTAEMAASTGISANMAGSLAGLAVTVAGSLLVNHIAPIAEPDDPGSTKPQWMLAGGPNQAVPYAAFPVVLGRHRFTPPLGANSYMTTNGSDRFLHLVLVWGYGPLDVSDIKIGETPLTSFEDVDIHHLTGAAFEYASGALDRSRPEVAAFLDCYGAATAQQQPQVKLDNGYTNRNTEQKNLTRADVVLSFPGGLVKFVEGKASTTDVEVGIEYRRLGYWSALGLWVDDVGDWASGASDIPGLPATQMAPLGQTGEVPSKTIIGLRNGYQVFMKTNGQTFVGDTVFEPTWPNMAPNELPIYRITDHTLTETLNTERFTGLALTITSQFIANGLNGPDETRWYAAVGSGTVDNAFWFNGSSATPFDRVLSFDLSSAPGQYEFRAKRITAVTNSQNISDNVFWLAMTEYAANEVPIRPPKPMAMSAVRIKATNQLNGTLDGISGLVRPLPLIWDGTEWRYPSQEEPRSNPAALLRYVLQHPGNAKARTDDQLDLPALQHFSEWCDSKGFIYENIVTSANRSVRDWAREIAAAGRASLSMPDGKWSVVIDEPKTTIAQHFTPHNSWGFKGRLLLPEIPHALKVSFLNRDKDYQPDEFTVYADGYSEANATLIETIPLPGVTSAGNSTTPGPVFKLGRFHLEQMLLRREEYEFYADEEAIVCTRGDRIEVAHDVPMWGLGSGRVKSVQTSGTDVVGITLDELVPMEAGKTYAVRWRTAGNQSSWASVEVTEGMGDVLNFLLPVTEIKPAAGDLVMFGETDRMTATLLVKAVEPLPNLQARIVTYDYAEGVFDAETAPFGTWSSRITLPPPLMRTIIRQVPIVEQVLADEFALTRSGSGWQANIVIRWRTDAATEAGGTVPMAEIIAQVEVQYRQSLLSSAGTPWMPAGLVAAREGTVTVGPLVEGFSYDVRLRFVGDSGRYGAWLAVPTTFVSGKTNLPVTVQNITYSFADTSLTTATVTLGWDVSAEPDIVDYLITRPGREVYVQANTFTELAEWLGDRTYTVQARDAVGNLSPVASVTITKRLPAAPVNFRASVVDNNVLFYWQAPPITTLPIDSYELRSGETWATATIIGRKAGGFTSVFEMTGGTKHYMLATIDTDGHYSAPTALSVSVDQPPDYVLQLDHDTTFGGTYSNALFEHGAVVLPIDTTETVGDHYTTRSWDTRQDQVTAGYPIYAQPAPTPGYYEDIIDLGVVVGSSRVTITPTIETIAGTPEVSILLSSKLNSGDAWTDHTGDQAYITNFRYVRARISVASSGDDLARLTGLNVRLDSKLKTISGTVAAVAGDTGGTTVYLTADRTSTGEPSFIDVEAIILTPQGTTPLTGIYDFTDAPNPTSMKVLLFDAAGDRASGTVSYSVRGF